MARLQSNPGSINTNYGDAAGRDCDQPGQGTLVGRAVGVAWRILIWPTHLP